MDKKNVLVTATNYSLLCAEAKKLLEENGFNIIENTFGRPMTFEELQQYAPQADAVVGGVDTWDARVFSFTPRLKVISRFGVGVDNINLADAKAHGVYVTNAPGINSNSVADIAVGLIIDLLRNISGLNQSTKQGMWERYIGSDLRGKTVGLLGFGAIAQRLAKKLSGFEMNLIAYDKYPNREAAKQLNVTLMDDIDSVLRASHIVSVHLPSLPETRHTMNAAAFNKMPCGSYMINTSRGALVDEKALYEALESGHLAGAATDVYEVEPIEKSNPLLTLPNMLTMPHTGAETYETYHDIGLLTAQAIIDTFAGKKPANLLNE
jgi:D-3-phosphoglycerate dehydrogenase